MHQLILDLPCQRWNGGASRMLPAEPGQSFDRRRYAVDVLHEAAAKGFVTEQHYSRSYPAAVLNVGLYGARSRLLGVAVFSVPMNQQVVPAYTSLPAAQGVELGRFVLLDEVPRNAESWMLGRAFDLLRQEKQHLHAVVSYSDPVPRRAADGRVVMPGHVGIIYQAHNGRLVGRSSARTLHVGPDGRVLSERTLSKIRLGEAGAASAQRTLESMGAPSRAPRESGADWVRRVLASGMFRPVRHPGNYCYAWPLVKGGSRKRVLELGFRAALPYPKHVHGAA